MGRLVFDRPHRLVATWMPDVHRSKNERRGLYYILDRDENDTDAAVPEPNAGGGATVVSGGGVSLLAKTASSSATLSCRATRDGGWHWLSLPDLPQD